jgi:hypothetical protein
MRVVHALSKRVLWPPCRSYAKRKVGDNAADRLLTLMVSLQFRLVHGFWPDFANPTRFSEKLWSRMLHARDPLLTLICDKLRVREYVAARVGAQHLVPLHWSGDTADRIPFASLPSQFVLKTNHGAGYNIVARDKAELDLPTATRQLERWLAANYCDDTYLGIEWGYKHVAAAIMAEHFLDENGRCPIDYKFWCFAGRVEFVLLHYDRFGRHRTVAVDRHFEPYDFNIGERVPITDFQDLETWKGQPARPENFDAMLDVAERVSVGLDFVRVDLYSIAGRIYFGEFTAYPGGVSISIYPPSRDRHLGSLWPGDARSIVLK